MVKLSKRFIALTVSVSMAFFVTARISAQTVDEDEIRSVGIDSVRFINYTGPYDRIDSLASIRAIGGDMGNIVAVSPTSPAQVGTRNRYYIVHAVGPEDGKKRDADIMYIGRDATVDNIVNVRRIISAYLSSAYGYNRADADTLAIFATVYNAVYRNKMDVFKERYKDVVIQNLTQENCGISLSYREWPGRTEIVIPLYNVARGGLSTVDTSVISDPNVIGSMREENDRNIDARQQMVDIKERQADDAATAAQQAQQQAAEAQREATAARQESQEAQREAATTQRESNAAQQQAQNAQQQAQNAQQQAQDAIRYAEENPDDPEAQRAAEEARRAAEEARRAAEEAQRAAEEAQRRADEAQRAADEAHQRADEAQRAADEAQQRADEARQQSAESQAEADRFQSEALNDRTGIAKDVQEMMREQAALARTQSVYGLHLVDAERGLSAIVQANTKNGNEIRRSPVTFIRNRTLHIEPNGYIAIAGEKSGNGAIRLVLIDPDTLTISKSGNENVAENSVLLKDGTDYYCVIEDGNKFVVAKYDTELTLNLKSPVYVHADTPITDAGDLLLVTSDDGNICLLNKADLTAVSE